MSRIAERARVAGADPGLEHVPEKLIDFSDILELGYIRVLIDENMLQLIDFERFLFDRMIPSGRETL